MRCVGGWFWVLFSLFGEVSWIQVVIYIYGCLVGVSFFLGDFLGAKVL